MNEQELYLFDLNGYITVPNVLDPQQLAQINKSIDETIVKNHNPQIRGNNPIRLHRSISDLIDYDPIKKYLKHLIGLDFRLDHDYFHVIREGGSGPSGFRLHCGGTPFDPAQYYHHHNGKIYCGLVVVAFNLTDVNPGDGGFGCVPGSHKSNYQFPDEWKDLRYMPSDCVREIPGKAGSAVIFTEAMTHGTLHWKGKGERRTLFFKYSPRNSAWSSEFYRPEDWEGLEDIQKFRLRMPGVFP